MCKFWQLMQAIEGLFKAFHATGLQSLACEGNELSHLCSEVRADFLRYNMKIWTRYVVIFPYLHALLSCRLPINLYR